MRSLISKHFKADYFVVGVLLLAIVAVVLSVYQLQQIFLSENQRSRELLQDRREYIEHAAKQLFLESLDHRMQVAIDAMEAAVDKPYRSVEGLYWYKNNQQLIPKPWTFSKLPEDNVITHYQLLNNRLLQSNPQSDWHEDEVLLWQLSQAVQLGNEQQIENLAREVMNYDANHRFASRHELVYRLVFVEQLSTYPQASRDLLSKLLREDLIDDRGSVLPGLQKEVLWRRNDLSLQEFEFLCKKISALSELKQIRVDDFSRAMVPKTDSVSRPDIESLSMPSIWQNQWYYFPAQSETYGLTIDLNEIQSSINSILLAQQWLGDGERVILLGPQQDLVQLEQIQFSWQSKNFEQNLEELQGFYQLKLFILMAGALSLAAAGFLVWLLYRRQARWVEVKSEFVATVAHEMRTPLSSIRLMAERLADTLSTETKAKDYPQRILSDIDTLSFLSENILSFERLQSGQWVAHTSPIALGEIIEDLQKELPLFVKLPFKLQAEGNADCTIDGDPTLIKLLFLNLAKNSCAYNQQQQADIRIDWQESGNGVQVDFKDNGIGIKEEEWQDCFMPFYRGKNQRHTRGSGLGLALCQKIMLLHGGSISIVSSSSSGTHFRLCFTSTKQAQDPE